jgi:monoterpene epsilon-lactone hydrolase
MPTSVRAAMARRAVEYEVRRRAQIVPIGGERTVADARQDLDRLSEIIHLPTGMTIADDDVGGITGLWLCPAAPDESSVVLYLHGGGYVAGSTHSHRGIAGHITEAIGMPTFLAEYRLAPEHPFPAALDDALAAYLALAEETSPDRILVMGDSAGGGLSLALGLTLRDRSLPLPGAIVALSPWTDLAGTGESLIDRAEDEVMLDPSKIREVGEMYAGDRPLSDPLVSPLYADPEGLPPTLIHVGDHEILLDDSVRFWEECREAGVDATLRVWPEMWHVFHAMAPWIPEAQQANREIARFWWQVSGTGPPQRRSTL